MSKDKELLLALVNATSKWAHHERALRYTEQEADLRLMVEAREEALRLCAEYDRL
jgi:hypothetical protein